MNNAATILATIRNLIELALPYLPDDELKSHLTETARRVDDRIADMAEAVKFGVVPVPIEPQDPPLTPT